MRTTLIAVLFCLAATMATACPVCITSPERTLADRLLEDQIAVLAAPDPDDPFRFIVTEVLRGDPDLLDDLPPIPFLVDRGTRDAAARTPDLSVLITYGATDPGIGDDPYALPAQDWARSILVTPERRAVLDAILQDGQDWFWGGEPEDPPRFAFFADLHGSEDPVLERMALTEIARASYGLIRTLDPAYSAAELSARMSQLREARYFGLYALMLGLSDDPAARDLVRRRAGTALQGGGDWVGAWLTALIEIDGAQAVRRIADAYLTDASGPLDDSFLGAMDALRVSGDARPDLRPVLAERLKSAGAARPEIAAETAYALYSWQDWSFLDTARSLLAAGAVEDHSAIYMLEVYRDTAAAFETSGG